MTPSVSRMVAGRRQELAYPLRWYSIPNLWRYERPQRGRLREHWQLNVDLFGVATVQADHEIILVADAIMQAYGAKHDDYTIHINSRKLIDHLLKEKLELKEKEAHDTAKLIDRKSKMSADEFVAQAKEILEDSNQVAHLLEFLNSKTLSSLPSSLQSHPSVEELKALFRLLAESGVTDAVFDPSVMRGFDYYTDIVFEVYDNNPENNRSMFGGGRYDGLVAMFGVEPVPTVGFGMGDVTLQNFLEGHKLLPKLHPETDVVAILIGDVYEAAQKTLSDLRAKGLRLAVDSSGRKLDTQIKSVAKAGVRYAVFIGKDELEADKFKLRDLEKGEERALSVAELTATLLG